MTRILVAALPSRPSTEREVCRGRRKYNASSLGFARYCRWKRRLFDRSDADLDIAGRVHAATIQPDFLRVEIWVQLLNGPLHAGFQVIGM